MSAERVIELALGAVEDFLRGEPHKTQARAALGTHGNQGKGAIDRSAASTRPASPSVAIVPAPIACRTRRRHSR